MKTSFLCRAATVVAPALFTACLAGAARADTVIDNFATGGTERREITCGVVDFSQPGSMAGGVRRARLIVNDEGAACTPPNVYRQRASIQVVRGGPLVVGTDFRVFERVELFYGQDIAHNNTPLNLDLDPERSPDARLRMRFAGLDTGLNVNVVLFMSNGSARAQCGINLGAQSTPFSVDFPLARFGVQLGTPNYADVDYVAVILQSGSAVGGNDFALQSIVATGAVDPLAWVASC